MGSFSNIFGKVPKVLVLEAFAEDPDEHFTAPEIMRITGISRRAAYLIIKKFVEEGLLIVVEDHKRPASYALNNSDLRAVVLKRVEPLLVIGRLESELKIEEGIPLTRIYPSGYLNELISRPLPNFSIDTDAFTKYSTFASETGTAVNTPPEIFAPLLQLSATAGAGT